MDVYERDSTLEEIKKRIPRFICNNYKTTAVDFGNGVSEPYTKFKTLKIDTEMFVEELRVEAGIRGIKMIERKFNSMEELMTLKEEAIFNCTGNSSKKLFPDENMKETLGHMLIFKNPNHLEYSLSANIG